MQGEESFGRFRIVGNHRFAVIRRLSAYLYVEITASLEEVGGR
jgi:hypothetical protein